MSAEPSALERFRDGLRRAGWRQGWFDRWLGIVIRTACVLARWRVSRAGLDRLPAGPNGVAGAGCLVVVVPHRAWIDPFLVVAAWPRAAARLGWFGDGETMVRSRWRRWLLPRIGMIPIAPGSGGPRAYADLVAVALAAGAAVVVFPERGPASAPDVTRPIAPGFAYLALRAGSPVVPVVLGGTHRIVRAAPFSVDILAPVAAGPPMADPFTPAGREAARRLVADVEAAVAQVLRDRTREADAQRPPRDRWPWLATLFR